MNARKWFAVALIVGWIGQTHYLWPLPPDTVEAVAAGLPQESRHLAADLEPSLWLSWALRALVIPLGIAGAALTISDHRKWPVAVFVVSLAYLVLTRAWVWLPIFYAPFFTTAERAAYRGAWLLQQPFLLFDTLLFPGLLVISIVYAAFTAVKRRRMRHAI